MTFIKDKFLLFTNFHFYFPLFFDRKATQDSCSYLIKLDITLSLNSPSKKDE